MTREQISGFKNIRTIIALAGCAFGLGLMVFGLGVGSSSKEQLTSAVKEESTKKLPAWNIALGDLVILARDMGFDAKGAKETPIDQTKIAGKIESQLQSLRELYRQETSKNSALMGGVVLQLSVGPSGEVSKVREIMSRISDTDFRRAVIAEASTWSFDQVLSEESTITCPLLFVREGMDITTLIQWEKNLSQSSDKPARGQTECERRINPADHHSYESRGFDQRSCRPASPASTATEGASRCRRRPLSDEIFNGDSQRAELFGSRRCSLRRGYKSDFAREKRRLVRSPLRRWPERFSAKRIHCSSRFGKEPFVTTS